MWLGMVAISGYILEIVGLHDTILAYNIKVYKQPMIQTPTTPTNLII